MLDVQEDVADVHADVADVLVDVVEKLEDVVVESSLLDQVVAVPRAFYLVPTSSSSFSPIIQQNNEWMCAPNEPQ